MNYLLPATVLRKDPRTFSTYFLSLSPFNSFWLICLQSKCVFSSYFRACSFGDFLPRRQPWSAMWIHKRGLCGRSRIWWSSTVTDLWRIEFFKGRCPACDTAVPGSVGYLVIHWHCLGTSSETCRSEHSDLLLFRHRRKDKFTVFFSQIMLSMKSI